MKAIHIICRREGISLRNLTHSKNEKGVYTSKCWALHKRDDPQELVGGWIYLHPTNKNSPSEVGGLVIAVASCIREDAATEGGFSFTFLLRAEGRGQHWRGADHGMAWTGGIVEANLPHEVVVSTKASGNVSPG
ncbi:hypothetical protein [Bradyrhizobium sp. HKCCYLRH1065]|uniref:hypothetical protein n=1 Tax=unclassified Bradyrhizobium TaxID=2631580 RepID=UPI003EB81B8C